MTKKILSVAGGLIMVLALLGGGFLWGKTNSFSSPVETMTETENSEVILAVERREEIVLLSTSTQGLYTTQNTAKLFKWGVPGSQKTNILQYKFTAKLGLDGKEVKVEEVSPGHFKLIIPPFKFIGFSDPEFKTVHQHGEALSFATADIDVAEGINAVLDEEKRAEHIQLNLDLLKEQTQTFYGGIIHAVDPEAELEFEFL
ncbi:hypothetical protein MHK13_07680 [Corynebacterium hadale]|uniref:hypothetical protein n=1 Tax=Corynebacterium hadale TaxID=2026255 RepID=UPI001EF1E35F|nr:hypothetical protein [Corynebacterium hadale]MCG7254610.1 hypothetical protein [Corynebacterium hadale]MCG7256139.1 hypothetical protein [Corynebacterium hadale]MCG7265976.1 hypothetical protein [Corynebacterium hadale]